jgi:hypothetical protein
VIADESLEVLLKLFFTSCVVKYNEEVAVEMMRTGELL